MAVTLSDDTLPKLENTEKPFLISPTSITYKVYFYLSRKFIWRAFRRPPLFSCPETLVNL